MIDARVVFLTHYIPLYQVRVLQNIAKSVRDFHVLVSTPIEPNRDFAPDWSGLDVTVQDTWTMRRQWRHRGDGEFADSLYIHIPYDTGRRLRALKPDVVMSLELGARSLGAANFCRRHADSKLILCTYMSERTEESRGRLRHVLRKRLVKTADAITYNGPSCRRYLDRFHIPDSKLFHLPYAADDRTLYRGPLDRDDQTTRHRLLVIGQLSSRKGVVGMAEQIGDYLRHHPNRQIEVLFAGDGPDRRALEAMSIPENLTLTLLGNVPAAELGGLMKSCGAMVAPTLADEWMLVVNEALQAGLPVIGSIHSQAVTTLVRDGQNGWQYDPIDPKSIFSALEHYFQLRGSELGEMRDRCRQSVHNRKPSWAASGAVDAIRHVLRPPTAQTSDEASRSETHSSMDPQNAMSAVQ